MVKKSYGCKKKIRPPKAAEIFWPFFFWCKIKILMKNFFLDLSGSEIFDISEFHECKIWSIFKSGGREFQRKWNFHGREISDFFFGGKNGQGEYKKKLTPKLILGQPHYSGLRREKKIPALLNISPQKISPNLTSVGFQFSLKLTPARFENGPNLTFVKYWNVKNFT